MELKKIAHGHKVKKTASIAYLHHCYRVISHFILHCDLILGVTHSHIRMVLVVTVQHFLGVGSERATSKGGSGRGDNVGGRESCPHCLV